MKKIIIDGIETHYTISENGEVYNENTKKFLKGTIKRNEYCTVQLTVNGKVNSVMVHRLVAMAYIDNPLGLPIVHHKDGNKFNNNVNNLEWVSYKENSLEKFDTNLNLKKEISLDNHEWKPVLGKEQLYKISDNGLISNIKTGKLLKGTIRNGYVRYNLQGKLYSAHRLVYETFIGEIPDGYIIDHIDGDRQNNSLENLRCITQSENAINAQKNGHKAQHKVLQYDLDDNFIKEYPSFTAAAKEFNVSYAAISSAAKRGGTSCGFKWKEVK